MAQAFAVLHAGRANPPALLVVGDHRPFGKNEQGRPASPPLEQAGERIVGPLGAVLEQSQVEALFECDDDQILGIELIRIPDQPVVAAGQPEQFDDPVKADRGHRQCMAAAVASGSCVGRIGHQHEEQDEGGDPGRDQPDDQARIERVALGHAQPLQAGAKAKSS